MKSYWFPLIAIGFLVFGMASIARTRAVRETAPPPLPPPAAPYEATVGGLGIVESNTENIAIGAPVSGLVTEVLVTVGSRVEAGDRSGASAAQGGVVRASYREGHTRPDQGTGAPQRIERAPSACKAAFIAIPCPGQQRKRIVLFAQVEIHT